MPAKKLKKQLKCCQPRSGAPASGAAMDKLAKLAWALAHPARVRIVHLLSGQTRCICGEIVDELPLAQSTVSQHLKILKDSGLVDGNVDGPTVCYCINPTALKELKTLVARL
jgi:ArsR family transcriptional regulator